MNLKNKSSYLIHFLIIPLFIINIILCFNNNNKVIPAPVELSTLALTIALTELETKNNNYVGNQQVYLKLKNQEHYKNYEKCQSTKDQCNPPILKLDNVMDLAKEKKFKKIFYEREDVGLIDFYKISMILFGKNFNSFTAFYLTLMSISIATFVINFKENVLYMLIVSSFLFINIFILYILPTLGNELVVVYNRRMLSILSIIPALHIALTIFDNKKLSYKTLLFLTLQIMLVILIIHFRSSAQYQLVFLFICCFYKYLQERLNYKFYLSFQVPITSTLVLLSFSLILLKSSIYFNLDSSYSTKRTGHLFWHPIHIGLSSHPEAMEKYDIYQSDAPSFDYVSKVAEKKFQNSNWTSYYDYDEFDQLLKTRVINIISNDPLFFIEAHIHKLINFFKLIFNELISKYYYFISIIILFMIFLSNWLLKYKNLQNAPQIICLIIFLCFCSFIPALMIYPLITYVLDTIILLFLSTIFVIVYSIYFFKNLFVVVNKK